MICGKYYVWGLIVFHDPVLFQGICGAV
jgi:hypothetical protein